MDAASAIRELEAESADLVWVNALLSSLWPKGSAALKRYVHEKLTPRLRDKLPAPLKQVRFERFSLGDGIPEFGEIEVARHSESHVQVELDLSYASDVDILLSFGGGISIGIRRLAFSGRLCVALRPLLDEKPVVGGVQVFFASRPRVDFRFAGLASVADFPGVAQKLQDAVHDALDKIVLPNVKSFNIAKDERVTEVLADARLQRPMGVLRVRVLRARNLAGAQLGAAAPDAYCKLRLGKSTSRTTTVRGSSSPQWPECEPGALFLVHHPTQELEISVLGEQLGGFLQLDLDSPLGSSSRLSVRCMLRDAAEETVGGVPRRRLTVALDPLHASRVAPELDLALEWFDLAAAPTPESLRTPSNDAPCVVLAEVHGGSGFPLGAALDKRRGLRWRCRLQSQTGQLSVSSYRGERRVKAPGADLGSIIEEPLQTVVEQLLQRHVPPAEIADIIKHRPEKVLEYLRAKADVAPMAELERDQGVQLQWNQTLPLLVRDTEAPVVVELVEGEDKVVGQLAPIKLTQLVAEAPAKRTYTLRPPAGAGQPVCGGLSSLFFLTCSCGGEPGADLYRDVRIEISLSCRSLVAGGEALLGSARGSRPGSCQQGSSSGGRGACAARGSSSVAERTSSRRHGPDAAPTLLGSQACASSSSKDSASASPASQSRPHGLGGA